MRTIGTQGISQSFQSLERCLAGEQHKNPGSTLRTIVKPMWQLPPSEAKTSNLAPKIPKQSTSPRLPENSTQENSTQENSTQENSTHENSSHENATHFKQLLIVIYIIHLYSLVVLLIIYAFDTIFGRRFS